MPYEDTSITVNESIEKLDREGMDIIEKQDPDAFQEYRERTKNTICGRYPVQILLHILNQSSLATSTQFIKYA